MGEADGGGEGGETERGQDGGAVDHLAEDGAEEQEIRAGRQDGDDLGRGVDGGGEERWGEASAGEAGAGVGSEGRRDGRREVEAVEVGFKGEREEGFGREGLVAEVEEQARCGAGWEGVAKGVGDGPEVCRGEVFFAQLEQGNGALLEVLGEANE